jgi:hypothetical protein
MQRLISFAVFALIASLCLPPARVDAQSRTSVSAVSPVTTSTSPDPLAVTAFDHFYNMDYERSIEEFTRLLDRRPNDPAAVNHLLSTVLMRELYRMGAMNTGEFANDSFIGQAHRPADPKVSGSRRKSGRAATQIKS